ncbi:MAG: hypothetical protein JXL85_02315 [Bacilli bacterium]|nr:hypothetical protein [Bacilli bacterium]
MKISDVVYKTIQEVDDMPRFDMIEKPRKAKWYLQIVAWLLSFPETIKCRTKIVKKDMKGLNGPYLMLCNHNSFFDFKAATKATFPKSSNYVVAIDGFINRESLLRNVGCIGKRKFISDTALIKSIKYSLSELGEICQVYPEARYSLVGTTAILPSSLGKMIKLLKCPVVTFINHGHHLQQPVWNLHKRNVRTRSDMTKLLTVDDINAMNADEIQAKVEAAFVYDDFKYQWEEKIKINYHDRAKNLHKMLYRCPNCNTDFSMRSDGNKLWCEQCNEVHEMDEYGRLRNLNGETKFSHIPDWFEWEREQVRQEIIAGNYEVEMEVDVDSLPNSTGFYRLGRGTLKHGGHGFDLHLRQEKTELHVHKHVLENYGVHVEYDYFGKGDGLSFSTIKDTYYLFPVDQSYSVTKFHFAVEELFKIEHAKHIKK